MNSKQQILQQENDKLHQLIDAVESALDEVMTAGGEWETQKSSSTSHNLGVASDAYNEAARKLATHISSLRQVGYKIEITWGD